jgi:hypothetical protein
VLRTKGVEDYNVKIARQSLLVGLRDFENN